LTVDATLLIEIQERTRPANHAHLSERVLHRLNDRALAGRYIARLCDVKMNFRILIWHSAQAFPFCSAFSVFSVVPVRCMHENHGKNGKSGAHKQGKRN
jgi:hypothetical protein